MRIVVKAPLMADKMKDLLDGNTFKGVQYAFVEKTGMEMTFEASGEGIESLDPAAIAKSAIKDTEFGKGIFFSVVEK